MKIKFCGGCNPFYDRKKVYIMLLKNKNIINVQEYIINNDLKDINEEKIYNWIIENIFK